jgi:hypothetical protein
LPHINGCKRGADEKTKKKKGEKRDASTKKVHGKRNVGGLERHLEIVPGPERRLTVTTTATDVEDFNTSIVRSRSLILESKTMHRYLIRGITL